MSTQTAPNPETSSQQQTTERKEPRRRELATLLDKVIENGVADNYARQMIDAEIARDLFDQDYRLARVFAESGEFDDLNKKTSDQAIATAMSKIRMGRSWNLNEADSMQFVFFNNGRPAIMNECYAGKIREAGYDWDIDWMKTEATANKRQAVIGCRLWLKKYDAQAHDFVPVLDRNGQQVSEEFTKDDADQAMIWEKGKQIKLSDKWNFQSWARDMYFWRALTRLRRFHLTHILRGAVIQEEAQDFAPRDVNADTAEQTGSRAAARAVLAEKLNSIRQENGAKRAEDDPAEKDTPDVGRGAAEEKTAETSKGQTRGFNFGGAK